MKNLSEFRETTLGEIARKDKHGLVDGPFGSHLPASEYTSSGIPVIRGSNLSLGQERFRAKDYVFVSEETANRLSRSLCHPDDIIFTKKGTLGQTGIVRRTETYKTFLLSSNQMKLSVYTEIADPLFVYYYVSSPISRERILREAMTTGVPKINLEYLRKFSISLPPLSTQRKIAAILSAYDDLIENNTRRIEILEEMARSIYREWFVNFRFPGHEQVKMVDSELRLIPEGWEVIPLGELASFQTGKLNSNAAKPNGAYQFFTCSQEILKTDTYSFDTECVLLAGNKAKGVFHIKYFKGKFDVYQRTYVIRSLNQQKITNYYLYFAIQAQLEHLKIRSPGAATKFLTLTILNNLKIAVSTSDIQHKFANFISVAFSKIELLQAKNANLRQTRDLLLPRLISGEIDVENLDIKTGEVAA